MLKTVPVGVPSEPSGWSGEGMLTTRELMSTSFPLAPGTLYRVDTPALLSETQNGPPGPWEMPQGLTRWASVTSATFGKSDTRFVCRTFADGRARSSRASRRGQADG